MQKPPNRNSVNRRDLLTLAPAAGVAACATATGGPAEAATDEPAPDHRQPRLANTKHVQTYYKLART